ncbi:hypothetical protein LYZ82_12360 [Xanthomonas hortorum pv. hederae]|uniref:hypothetical protein n=1 Tax=Xanthomonas hortorum TaxID=56454 RepID=UPI0015E4360F|nr:hypothetical protein [Xanthomonas hortorum]MCE4371810.1 hypothetical protein [Xanthomonas hortorum pv. hederae]
MTNAHANDKIAALNSAPKLARAGAHFGKLVQLNHMLALQEFLDEAQREACGG